MTAITNELGIGDKVRVRRYQVQGTSRKLAREHEGTVISTDRYGITLDAEPGYIGTGYVFLGMHDGEAMNLITEIELIERVADERDAAPAETCTECGASAGQPYQVYCIADQATA